MVTIQGLDWAGLKQVIADDAMIQQLTKDLLTNEKMHVGFVVCDGRLLYKGRYVIPHSSVFIPALLHEYHDSLIGGHSRELKTYL